MEQSGHYDELPLWSAPFGLVLLDTVRIRSGMSVLDVGSGGGFPMIELAERLGNDSMVHGIDPQPALRELILEKARLKGISNIDIRTGCAEEIPFPKDYFDLIVSNNGLNNVQDLEKSLAECLRVLKPAGQLVFTLNLPHTMNEFYEVLGEILSELGLNQEIRMMQDHIDHLRKPADYLKRLLLITGFGIQSIQLEGFKIRFANTRAMLNHSLIRNSFYPAWRSVVPEEKAGEIFEMVEQRLDDSAGSRGFVELSIPFACFDCTK